MARISKVMAAVAGAIAAFFLVAASVAHAETAWWRGEYVQGGRATPLDAILTIEGGRVEGRFKERNSFADRRFPHIFSTVVDGAVTERNIRFIKFYDGFARITGNIHYAGTIDHSGGLIAGEWRNSGGRGTFSLRRIVTPPVSASMPNSRRIVELLRTSEMNRLEPQFGDLFWEFTPRIPASMQRGGRLDARLRRMDRSALTEGLTESITLNLPALQAHTLNQCRTLTADQREALRAVARQRYDLLLQRLSIRRGAIAAAMGTEVSAVSAAAAPLRFSADCGAGAQAGVASMGRQDQIVVGDDLLLSALFSAMFVDAQWFVAPDRAFADMGGFQFQGVDSQDISQLDDIQFRIRALPLWTNVMRQQRMLAAQQRVPTHQFEAGWFGAQCPDNSNMCWFMQSMAQSMLSAFKSNAMIRDQFDFVLAHEIGHYALRHFTPVADCAAEKPLERDADFFAVALIRPDTGLFTETRRNRLENTDNRFQSGVELFLTQDYTTLRAGGCQYPPFADRIAAAKAFEARAFPPAR